MNLLQALNALKKRPGVDRTLRGAWWRGGGLSITQMINM